jgi:hypothetical protein
MKELLIDWAKEHPEDTDAVIYLLDCLDAFEAAEGLSTEWFGKGLAVESKWKKAIDDLFDELHRGK